MPDSLLSMFAFNTERLHLRPLNAGDEILYRDLYTDAETMRHIAPPLSIEQSRRSFLKTLALMHKQPTAWLLLAILTKATMEPIGICGVPHFDAGASRFEVGVMLLSGFHGAGFAKESKTGLMRRLFSLLPVSEIWVEYELGNVAAARSNRSIGFLPCQDAMIGSGKPGKCVMSVCRESWWRSIA
ncbi:MAG: GNAT family N-acetyltransferase [Lysobacteraceae bacterium]